MGFKVSIEKERKENNYQIEKHFLKNDFYYTFYYIFQEFLNQLKFI